MSARQRASCSRRGSRGPGIVGNVVDGAAKRIDFEHRLALGARQNAHAGIKRAAGGPLGRLGWLAHLRTPRLLRTAEGRRPSRRDTPRRMPTA